MQFDFLKWFEPKIEDAVGIFEKALKKLEDVKVVAKARAEFHLLEARAHTEANLAYNTTLTTAEQIKTNIEKIIKV